MLFRLPLLLLSLAPLLAVLLAGAINPRPAVSLRLLTWRSPTLPLGSWMAIAAGGGAALSGAATALALRQSLPSPARRQRRVVREFRPDEAVPFRPSPEPEPSWSEPREWSSAAAAAAGPSRMPGEPAPTLSVPFRVLHRPAAARPSGPDPEPVPVRREPAAADDWNVSEDEDW